MRNLLLSIAVCAIAAAPAVFGQSLDVRPGLWETTITMHSNGQLPIDTSRMTPEQRARVEAAMQATMARMAQPTTSKSCVTKEDIAKAFSRELPQNCKRTIVSSSRNKMEVKASCQGTRIGSDTDVLVEALSRESVKVTTHTNMTSNGRNTTMVMNGTSKWIGDSCGDVK